MSAGRAVQTFGLQVPAGDEPTPVVEFGEYPATIRLTMAALDPTEKIEDANSEDFKGAVLRIIRIPDEDEDDEDDEDEDDYDDDMAHLLDEEDSEEEDDEAGDAKASKATKAAALKAAVNGDSIEVDGAAEKGKKGKKAAAIAAAIAAAEEEDDEDEDEDDDEDDLDLDGLDDELPAPEEFVLCTLDPKQHYQQTLDITIDERETVFFQVSGTHTVYLTGNIIMPDADDYDDSDSEDDSDYDQSPDEDELDLLEDDISDEEDILDSLDNPRVTELDDDEAPALVAAAPAKGKNKRAAEDDSMVDASMTSAASATSADGANLSKAQKKKLAKKQKDNDGNAVAPAAVGAAAATTTKAEAPAAAKADKKTVQFKEGLVQGPTPSSPKPTTTPTATSTPTTNNPRTVSGITVDDRKLGSGPAAKKGDRVSMRYIGKLEKTKAVFDSNKKGKPFSFVLGKGEVIKGWDLGVAGMQAGGERRLTIPAGLAYGSQKQAGIPPNSTLVFDVKCLEIK